MSRYLKERYQAMEAYIPGEQPRDMQYIKLNTNESPYPPAPSVVKVLKETDMENLRLYSDPTCKVLKEKLAALYNVKPENLFISNGSDDILNFIFMAFPGKNGAIFPDITYGFYTVFADLHGVNYRQIPLKEDFSLNYQDYCNQEALIVIANPNAPTGRKISNGEIEEILKSNPDNVVAIDEAYVDFGGESCYPLMEKYDNLLVVRTYSKSRCLAGGRLGYAIGPAGLIADLEKIKFSTNPFSINRLTLTIGEATIDAEDYYQARCADIIAARDWTTKALEALGFTVLPSYGNFVFAKSDDFGGEELYLKLKRRGILVRHFSSPRIRDFNRITIGTMEQMRKLVETVAEILQEGKV